MVGGCVRAQEGVFGPDAQRASAPAGGCFRVGVGEASVEGQPLTGLRHGQTRVLGKQLGARAAARGATARLVGTVV